MTKTPEDDALVALRHALEERGIKSKSSAGKYEYFYAFLTTDGNGTPVDDLFIVIRDDTYFSWSRDSRVPIDDVQEAAREIARILRQATRSEG